MPPDIDTKNLKHVFILALQELQAKNNHESHSYDTMSMVYKRAISSLKAASNDDIDSIYALINVRGIGKSLLSSLVRFYSQKHLLEAVANGKTPHDYRQKPAAGVKRKNTPKQNTNKQDQNANNPEQQNRNNLEQHHHNPEQPHGNNTEQPPAKKRQMPKKRQISNKRQYIPKVRSGAYAILLALLENMFLMQNSMIKEEIAEFGGRYCDASFQPNASTNDYFSAWSSMKQLINKELVEELNGKKRPQRYGLSTEGMILAATLKKIHALDFNRYSDESETTWRREWNRFYRRTAEEHGLALNSELIFPCGDKYDSDIGDENSSDPGDKYNSDTGDKNNSDTDDKNEIDRNDNFPRSLYGKNGSSGTAKNHQSVLLSDLLGLEQHEKEPLRSLLSANNSINYSFLPTSAQAGGNVTSNIHSSKHSAPGSNPVETNLIENNPAENNTVQTNHVNVSAGSKAYFQSTPYETWPYRSYVIVLLIDTREVRSIQNRDFFTSELAKKGISAETRQLAIGDFVWIARHNETKKEVFLNCIIERKRIDDLCSSIRDSRFYEQKQRLKKTGYKWCFYVVEESLLNNRLMNMMEAIKTAFFEVTLDSGFILQRTKGSSETVSFLITLHQLLSQRLLSKEKSILAIKATEFETQQQFKDTLQTFRQEFEKPVENRSKKEVFPAVYECCHMFTNFQSVMGKSTFITSKQLYLSALLSVKGCSFEKALTIYSRYPSLKQLLAGYSGCTTRKESEMFLAGMFDLYPAHKKIGKTLSEKFHEAFGKKSF